MEPLKVRPAPPRAARGGLMVLAAVLAAGPATAQVTYSFDTGTTAATRISVGGSPADANVAASSTHICVTARGAFACYSKAGTLVKLGPDLEARPYEAAEFFAAHGIAVGPIVSGTAAKDGRVVFDRYRKRLFVVFQSREEHPRLLIAVSKSEDPSDGFWPYADVVEDSQVNGHDYLWLGVNATHLLVSNNMRHCEGTYPTWDCSTQARTRHFMYPTDKLVAGLAYVRGEGPPHTVRDAVPCVHDTYSTAAFWVHRDDATHATVYRKSGGLVTQKQVTIQTGGGPVNGAQLGGSSVIYTNIGSSPQNCHYRGGRLAFASNDGHTWSGQSSPSNAVHLVRLKVSDWPAVTVEIDRVFGRASVGDPAGIVYDYGWPAVAIGSDDDLVIGSVRTDSTLYAELRGSVWYDGSGDISSSVLLKSSSSALSSFHMAGAAADPTTSGVYLAQQFGSSNPGWRVNVSKLLGSVKPDLVASAVAAPPVLSPGYWTAQVTVTNQGDGPMPASLAQLYLSPDDFIQVLAPDADPDWLLGTVSVPALAAGQAYTATVLFGITGSQVPGAYFIGAWVDSGGAASEHSEVNNKNPFLGGNRGNTPVTIAN
jgi:CARDB protein